MEDPTPRRGSWPTAGGIFVWAYLTAVLLVLVWSWTVSPARRALFLADQELSIYRERLAALENLRARARAATFQGRRRRGLMRAIASQFTPQVQGVEPLLRRLLRTREGLLNRSVPIERQSMSFVLRAAGRHPEDLQAMLDSIADPHVRTLLPAGSKLVAPRMRVGRHSVTFRFHMRFGWLMRLLTALECYPFHVDLARLDVAPVMGKKGIVANDPVLLGRVTLVIHSLTPIATRRRR